MIPIIPEEDVYKDMHNNKYDTISYVPSGENEIEKCYAHVINFFQKNNPNPTTELVHKNGYELLVATILSAQCTDKRVNVVTPSLFEKYPDPDALAKANIEDVHQYIGSITFSGNKSDYLVRMANMLMTKYHGIIPSDENRLQKLPGVGRKTANVIMATLFNKPAIAVDTHVFRVSNRIGLATDAKTPLEVEEQLMNHTPKEFVTRMSHWLILHGRNICTAKNPRCMKCGIKDVCRYFNTKNNKK